MTGESYTIKERIEDLAKTIADQLSGIVAQLTEIDRKLDDKASNARVRDLETRFDAFREKVDGRFGALEATKAGGVAIGKVGMWLIGTVGVAIFLAVMALITTVISGGRP